MLQIRGSTTREDLLLAHSKKNILEWEKSSGKTAKIYKQIISFGVEGLGVPCSEAGHATVVLDTIKRVCW
jgi:hypothetical protein